MKKFLMSLLVLLLVFNTALAANFDVTAYTEDELREIRHEISLALQDSKKGDLLYSDDNIEISYLGWKKEYSSYKLWATVVNKSDKLLMVSSDHTSVNDCACYAESSFEVPAGKQTNTSIFSVSESTLEEQWIDQIDHVEFSLHYYDSNDWEGLRVEIEKPFVIDYVE